MVYNVDNQIIKMLEDIPATIRGIEMGNPNYNNIPQTNRSARQEYRDEILKVAKEACRRLGGVAIIDEGFVVVDTKLFDVTEKSGNVEV